METSSGPRRRRQSFLRSILVVAALGLSAPAVYASSVAPLSPQAVTSYQQALDAYNAGNISTALIYAKAAGAAGDVRAQLLAGHILKNGQTGSVQKSDAAHWYEKAAMSGDTDAMVALGELGHKYEGGLMPEDTLTWWTKAAQAGRTDAMRALADMHIKGVGVPRNPREGLDWLTLAADQGDAESARRIGDYYIDSAPEAALSYYEKAAAAGDAQSAYTAAIMYAENLSIRPNDKVAARLMAQAAKAGHAAAMADYGLLIFQGIAGDGQASTAADWFKKAAKAGDDQGKFFYAYALAKGDGAPQDLDAAYFWIVQTNKSGIPDYDKDIDTLRTALEGKLSPQTQAEIRARAGK